MKKRFFLAIALISFAASCSKEPTEDAPQMQSVKFSLTMAIPSDGPAWKWAKGEKISVFDGQKNQEFSTPIASTNSSATFSGNAFPANPYYVLAPYVEKATYRAGVISAVIPVDQKAVPGGSEHVSGLFVGQTVQDGSNLKVNLKNACAYLKLTFTTSGKIKKITVKGKNDEKLAGNVNVSIKDGVPVCEGASSAEVSLVESGSAISAGTYFLNIFPGNYSKGLTVLFQFADGSIKNFDLYASGLNLACGAMASPEAINVDSGFEEEPDDSTIDVFISTISKNYGMDYAKMQKMGHPRLFMTAADFETVKEKVRKADMSDLVYQFHKQVMIQAESDVVDNSKLEHKLNDSKKLLTVSRAALKRLFSCAYAYRVTGEERFLTKARADLATVCAFPDWNNKNHFLDPSEMALGVAVAYDWLYYDLNLQERVAAHQAMLKYDLEPFAKYEATESNNWNQVCNGGALAAAIVLYEKEKANCGAAIDKAIKSNRPAVRNMYNPNGSGTEGYGYWQYAMMYQTVIFQALDCAFGTSCKLDEEPGLRKTGQWFLYMDGVIGPFGFSDSSDEVRDPSSPMVSLAAKLGQPENLVTELRNLNLGVRYTSRTLPLCVAALVRYPFSSTAATYPSEKVWVARGSDEPSPLVLTRIGWKYDDTDKYFGLKGAGGGYNNHSHMDGGSFVFDALGTRWAADIPQGGYTAYEVAFSKFDQGFFGRSQKAYRWEVLCQNSYFHNVLAFGYSTKTVGESGEKWHVTDQIAGSSETGGPRGDVLAEYRSESEGFGGKIDLTPMYSDAVSSASRTCKFVGDDFYVIDEIESLSGHSAPFEWRMVTMAGIELNGNYVTLTRNGKTMYMTVSVNGDASAPVWGREDEIKRPSTWIAWEWDSYQSYAGYHVVKYSSEVPSGARTATFTVKFSPVKPN